MKTIRTAMYVFLGLGLLMLFGGGVLFVKTSGFVSRAVSTTGTVVELREHRDSDGDTLYKPVVRYAPARGGEIIFESNVSSRPPAYDVGERVEVLYESSDPEGARIKGFGSLWLGPIIFSALGFLFSAIGVGYVLYRRASQKQKNYLMAYGTAVDTQFQSVERNTSLEVNGRHPWRIVSQWQNPASGNLRLFNSENLWFDPTEFVKAGKITVLLDPKNEKRYYMDVSFLPKLEQS